MPLREPPASPSGGSGCCVYALDSIEPDAAAYARFVKPVAGIVEDTAPSWMRGLGVLAA